MYFIYIYGNYNTADRTNAFFITFTVYFKNVYWTQVFLNHVTEWSISVAPSHKKQEKNPNMIYVGVLRMNLEASMLSGGTTANASSVSRRQHSEQAVHRGNVF